MRRLHCCGVSYGNYGIKNCLNFAPERNICNVGKTTYQLKLSFTKDKSGTTEFNISIKRF